VPERRPHDDEVIAAVDALVTVLGESTQRNRLATKQAQAIKRLQKAGQSYGNIFSRDEHSLIRQVTRKNVDQLLRASARLRWAEARALHAEGMTMDKIAVLFGVTRQRISGLLREEWHGQEPE
jgi:predicted XRE-type DNA-binding protein